MKGKCPCPASRFTHKAHFENAVRVPVCDNPATDLDVRERVGICKQ